MKKRLWLGAVCSILFLVGVVAQSPQAHAETLPANVGFDLTSRGATPIAQTLYIFVKSGEHVQALFTKESIVSGTAANNGAIVLKSPTGWVSPTLTIDGTGSVGDTATLSGIPVATSDGIWELTITSNVNVPGGNLRINWDVGAYTAANALIPGRVWTEKVEIIQWNMPGAADITLYNLNKEGYLYQSVFRQYNGVNSSFITNAFGLTQNSTCQPAYMSTGIMVNPLSTDPSGYTPRSDCGGTFKIFFSNPSTAGLPASGDLPDGTTDWIMRPSVVPASIANLAFTPTDINAGMAGTVSATLSDYAGHLTLLVDTNNNGVFTDPVDRTIESSSNEGAWTFAFDGKDGTGANIPARSSMKFRLLADRQGEIHFTRGDDELNAGGIEVNRLNGSSNSPTVLFWNDSQLQSNTCGTKTISPINNSTTGTSSTGGVHGWDITGCVRPGGGTSNGNTNGDPAITNAAEYAAASSWGNMRYIDDWTYDLGAVLAELTFNYVPPATPAVPATPTLAKTGGNEVLSIVTAAGILALAAAFYAHRRFLHTTTFRR